MNKRMKVTIFATCALLMCLLASTALAVNSTAYVDYGSTAWVTGGSQPLNTSGLSGSVYSYSSSTGTTSQKLRGEMWTKGVIFSVQRSYKEVSPKTSANLPAWSNPNQETGTFFAKARAQYGNHEGYCRVSQ